MCSLSFLLQDVDCAYMSKSDLETKVGAMADQIRFLRAVYEQVKESFCSVSYLGLSS